MKTFLEKLTFEATISHLSFSLRKFQIVFGGILMHDTWRTWAPRDRAEAQAERRRESEKNLGSKGHRSDSPACGAHITHLLCSILTEMTQSLCHWTAVYNWLCTRSMADSSAMSPSVTHGDRGGRGNLPISSSNTDHATGLNSGFYSLNMELSSYP